MLVNLKDPDWVYDHLEFDGTIEENAGGDKNKKVFCIYEGYDEYNGKHENFFREKILDKRKTHKYKEIKFIVTIRLE